MSQDITGPPEPFDAGRKKFRILAQLVKSRLWMTSKLSVTTGWLFLMEDATTPSIAALGGR
jgi:hypothetical protein